MSDTKVELSLSPFIEYNEEKSLEEQFYTDKTAETLKNMYKNRKHLFNSCLRMYKFLLLDTNKLTENFSKKNVQKIDEIINMKIINGINYNDITTISLEYKQKIIYKKVDIIPVIFDFLYIYYIHYFDNNAPFHKLPMTTAKLNLIFNAIHCEKYQEINELFEDVIDNKIINTMRQQPPFYLTTDMSLNEIDEKINLLIIPIIKSIMDRLLHHKL